MRASRAEYQQEWKQNNPGKSAAYTKKWRDNNKEKSRKSGRDSMKIRILKVKLELIQAYGGKCNCCGEHMLEFLSLDHMIPGDGATHRKKFRTSHKIYLHLKKLGFPKDGYRVLCFKL